MFQVTPSTVQGLCKKPFEKPLATREIDARDREREIDLREIERLERQRERERLEKERERDSQERERERDWIYIDR